MSQTYFTLICYGTRNTECLQSLADRCRRIGSSAAAFLDCDCRAYRVSPARIFKTDWLDLLYLIVYIQSGILRDLLSFFDRRNALAI